LLQTQTNNIASSHEGKGAAGTLHHLLALLLLRLLMQGHHGSRVLANLAVILCAPAHIQEHEIMPGKEVVIKLCLGK